MPMLATFLLGDGIEGRRGRVFAVAQFRRFCRRNVNSSGKSLSVVFPRAELATGGQIVGNPANRIAVCAKASAASLRRVASDDITGPLIELRQVFWDNSRGARPRHPIRFLAARAPLPEPRPSCFRCH